jgi:hypothetical protein
VSDLTGDLVTLVDQQEQIRRTAGAYDGFVDQPGLAASLATSGVSSGDIQAVGGFVKGLALSQRVMLARQSRVVLNLTDDERGLLTAIGTHYDDVDVAQRGKQWAGGNGGVLAAVSGAVNRTTQLPVIKQVFGGLDRLSDVANTAYRTQSMGIRSGVANLTGGQQPNDYVEQSLTMQQQGYQEDLLGKLSFLSRGKLQFHSMDDLRNEYDPEMVELAKRYVIDPDGFMAPSVSTDELIKRDKLLQDPRFQGLTEEVDARHISPGRDLANALGLQAGTKPFTAVSGAQDAIYTFMADPTLVAGKVNAGVKVFRYGIGQLSDVGRIDSLMRGNRAVQRGWQSLLTDAKIMRRGTMEGSALDKADAAAAYAHARSLTPDLMPLVDEINGGGLRAGKVIDTYDDLVEHVTGTGALIRLRNGLAAREAPLMPGAVSSFALRRITANLAAASTWGGVKALALDVDGGRYLQSAADAVLANGVDATGLDKAVAAGGHAAGVGQAAAAYRKTLKGRLTTAVNRMTLLLPEHQSIDLTTGAGAEDIRRFAAMYMPRTHASALAAQFSVASLAERRAIAEGMYEQVTHAAGLPASVTGRAWLEDQRAHRALEDSSAYDATGADRDLIAGTDGEVTRREALYMGQTSTKFMLPNFAELRRISAKVSIYDHVLRSGLESSVMDSVMHTVRTGWLLNPASAQRNAIENLLSAMAQGLPAADVARARTALSSVTAGRSADRLIGMASREVDPRYRRMAGTVRGVLVGRVLSGMRRAEHVVGAKVSGDEWARRAEELVDSSTSGDLRELDAMVGLGTRGAHQSVDEAVTLMDKGFKVATAGFRKAGYHLDSADGAGGARHWANELGRRFAGSDGAHVLNAVTKGTPEAHEALIQHLLSDEFTTGRATMERFHVLRDGTKVGKDPAMLRRAAEELADDQVEDMRSLITGRNGVVNDELAKHLTSGGTPSVKMLLSLGEDARPERVIQPKFVPDLTGPGGHAANVVQALGDKAYKHAVADPLNWMSTLPIFHANYVKAYRNVDAEVRRLNPGAVEAEEADIAAAEKKLAQAKTAHEAAPSADTKKKLAAAERKRIAAEAKGWGKHVRETARMHAMDRTALMIDNPRVRSQMSLITRNVFNFWRAQEDFGRRWARNLKENPAMLRKAQLVVEGGMHTGLVYRDENGELVFSYPGSGYAIQAVGKAMDVFGLGHYVGLGATPNMTTKLQFLNSGLDRPFLPSTSPVAGIPLRALKHFTGDQVGMVQALQITEGEIGAGRGWWSQFLPSPVYRILASQSTDEREGQYASAARNAMLNLYAAGLTPGAAAQPDEHDAFKQRVRTGVRNQLAARALLAAILPGAPGNPTEETEGSRANKQEGAAFNSVSLQGEFRAMVSRYGYAEALAVWTAAHPDDLAYTVSTTEGKGGTGGYVAPTNEVLSWIKDNPELVAKYPSLAAYFAPDGPGDFSSDAWRVELELGLRQHKNLDTFYRDVSVKNAENAYYTKRDKRDIRVSAATAAGDDVEAKRVKDSFAYWSGEFQKVNPLLVEKWQAGNLNKTRSAALVTEVEAFADSPLGAQFDPRGDLGRLARAHRKKTLWDDTHKGRTDADQAEKSAYDQQYKDFVGRLLGRSPDLIPLYRGVYDKVE